MMLLQKTFWPLLLEMFMNEPGNKTCGVLGLLTKMDKDQVMQMLPELSAACDTASDEVLLTNCTSWQELRELHQAAILDPSSRSHKAPERQLLLLSVSLDMKNTTWFNSSNTPI